MAILASTLNTCNYRHIETEITYLFSLIESVTTMYIEDHLTLTFMFVEV